MDKQTTSTPIWRNRKAVPIILQAIFVIVVGFALYFMITNMLYGLEQIGLRLGLDYLQLKASFPIAESLISYSPDDPYIRALFVGLLNTFKVSFFGIVIASILGIIVGISRLSNNWMIKKLATVYVEVFRNTPLLVQIFIWNFAVFLPMPKIQEALHVGPFYFSNRGTAIPWFQVHATTGIWLIILVVLVIAAIVLYKLLRKKEIETGKNAYPFIISIASFMAGCSLIFIAIGSGPVHFTTPAVQNGAFVGGTTLSIGFLSVLIALSIYTSTYIAEIVRGGIMGVPNGQTEAAKALGFKGSISLRLIIFPQAIRIIIPPLTSQYLNLIKNSSLAMAVAYQDIVGIGNTVINQTGHTIETIFIIIAVYLFFSLTTSLFMNFFNKKFQLVER
ncbi:amino acid ABC transporter permease [Niallia sp. NCCP-28]|uniref:amino acid ABC transporter permease n=1 Tax=Niallia sp. NCCP-28 TaxID=2934712 RepID=UPI00200B2B9C|nr:ABC transporter permease subunit [Niallia sp. NCCP-28]GKU82273.1 polar amino acid ABC transporter permease [Niallia sp. NCCP-28]